MLQGLVKQREDSIFQFRKANRPELVQKEEAEIEVLRVLPARRRPRPPTIEKAVGEAVAETGAASAKDIGKVDEGGDGRACRPRGKPVDGKKVNDAVRRGWAPDRPCARASARSASGSWSGFDGLEASPEVKQLIRDFGVGHVILFARNVDAPGAGGGAGARAAGAGARRRPRAAAADRRGPGGRAGRAPGPALDGRGRPCGRWAASAPRTWPGAMGEALAAELLGLRHPLRLRARAWTWTPTRTTRSSATGRSATIPDAGGAPGRRA